MAFTVEFTTHIKGGLPVRVEAEVSHFRYEGNICDSELYGEVEITSIKFPKGRSEVPEWLVSPTDMKRLEDEALEHAHD